LAAAVAWLAAATANDDAALLATCAAVLAFAGLVGTAPVPLAADADTDVPASGTAAAGMALGVHTTLNFNAHVDFKDGLHELLFLHLPYT